MIRFESLLKTGRAMFIRTRNPRRCIGKTSSFIGLGASHLLSLAVLVIVGCGSTQQLPSSWDNNSISIDGVASEWGSGLANLKDTKVFLGVRNDDDYVYLCLKSQDPQFRRQIMGLGLTVWFEGQGGNRLGVLYPIGMLKQEGRAAFEPGDSQDEGDREHIIQRALQDFEILGPGKGDRNLFSVVQSPGVKLKVGGERGPTVYELKVPLKKSTEHPYAIGADAGSVIRIEIATGKFESGGRSFGMSEGMRGGGRRPRGGEGMPGEGMPDGEVRGEGRPSRGNRPEPLDVTVDVHLAGPTSETNSLH